MKSSKYFKRSSWEQIFGRYLPHKGGIALQWWWWSLFDHILPSMIFLPPQFNITIIISISLTFHYSHTINSIQYQFLTKDKTCFNLLLIKKRAVDAQINLRSRYLFWLNIIRTTLLCTACFFSWCSFQIKSNIYIGWKVNMKWNYTIILPEQWGYHQHI